ncbi:hypothetical protein GGP41_006572 [Bipolaris sorokiniana]|uniref:Small secreted protein n=2 Tax=Cochliobolus sativus TaxID=45130 RepID=A0A8H5ZRK4_COCSA|nr:uncharacterized protein COCSADRAFT_36697 [Bipolaris sorokiniana ND90Pr]EMD64116.1 hypothetical protein COCSADRAFT_36697 [Bipolaris sorokiniana ND90Pr]KAF5853809.1 hypothetical protein GGP41_006572 [Bipolaris sorokiniana]
MKTSVIASLFASCALAQVLTVNQLNTELAKICQGKQPGDACNWNYSYSFPAYPGPGTTIQTCKATTFCNCGNSPKVCTVGSPEYQQNTLICQTPPASACTKRTIS